MSIVIELKQEVEDQLREIAAERGQDAVTFARTAVEEKIRMLRDSPVNGVPLDKLMEGRVGVFRSRNGQGTSRVSEQEWEAMADDLLEKKKRGHL